MCWVRKWISLNLAQCPIYNIHILESLSWAGCFSTYRQVNIITKISRTPSNSFKKLCGAKRMRWRISCSCWKLSLIYVNKVLQLKETYIKDSFLQRFGTFLILWIFYLKKLSNFQQYELVIQWFIEQTNVDYESILWLPRNKNWILNYLFLTHKFLSWYINTFYDEVFLIGKNKCLLLQSFHLGD